MKTMTIISGVAALTLLAGCGGANGPAVADNFQATPAAAVGDDNDTAVPVAAENEAEHGHPHGGNEAEHSH